MISDTLPLPANCDPNYKKVGIKLFGLIYGGDSVSDVLCNLNKMNFPYKYGFSKKGVNKKINRAVDDKRIKNLTFGSLDYENYDEISFENIKIAGIEFKGWIEFKCATNVPEIGMVKILLDQNRVIPRYKGTVYVCHVEEIRLFALEEKIDRNRRTQKMKLLMETIKNGLKERGFRDSSVWEKKEGHSDVKINKLHFLQDGLSGEVYNKMSVGGDNIITNTTEILIYYDPLNEKDPLIRNSLHFPTKQKFKQELDTSSEIKM